MRQLIHTNESWTGLVLGLSLGLSLGLVMFPHGVLKLLGR